MSSDCSRQARRHLSVARSTRMARVGDELVNPITGERIVFRKTAAETEGALLEMDDFWMRPGHRAPAHVHPGMRECWKMITGTASFVIGGVERSAKRGEVVVADPGWRTKRGIQPQSPCICALRCAPRCVGRRSSSDCSRSPPTHTGAGMGGPTRHVYSSWCASSHGRSRSRRMVATERKISGITR